MGPSATGLLAPGHPNPWCKELAGGRSQSWHEAWGGDNMVQKGKSRWGGCGLKGGDMGWGRKETKGWERRNRAGELGQGKGLERAEGHQEDGEDIWGLPLILQPGWVQLAVQGVCSREQMHSTHGTGSGTGRGLVVGSCSWGQRLGKGHIPGRRGGGRLEQIPVQRQWERTEYWSNAGGSKATPVHHKSAFWGCPLFSDNAECDAPVHPCNDWEGSSLSGA